MAQLVKIYKENKKLIKNLLLLSLILIIFDQVTKIIAQKYLENSSAIIIVPDVLSLVFVRNVINHFYQYIIYFILTIIVLPVIILQSMDKSYSKLVVIGLTLLWSAVFSNNVVDAFTLGYIRDFINLHGIAVGNVADQYRTIGLLVVIAGLIIKGDKKITPAVVIKVIIILTIALILTALFWRYLAKTMAI